jgi:hypothetical protein
MPVPPPDKLWRNTPYYLVDDGDLRHAIGWQDSKKGPCFVVARRGFLADKVLDRFPLTPEGWAQAWAALAGLDAQAAQAVATKLGENAGQAGETERQAQLYQAFVDAGGTSVFRWLGVQVLAGTGEVYTIGIHSAAARTNASRLLGPLAGAQAMVTDGAQAWSPGRAMFLPIALTGLATKTMADAAVVFPDGTVHLTALDGNATVREAQRQVVQFNALASAADTAPAAPESAIDPAIRLRRLHELLDAGLLTQEEYEAKRTEIINSI